MRIGQKTDIRPFCTKAFNCAIATFIKSAEISVLQDVFPTMPREKLQFALREYQTVDAAAAFLLRDAGLEGQSDCEGEFDSASLNYTGQSFSNRINCEGK